jgi:predicted nucleotide-binding protein (sugar kinase/HSP70/actin superfamily)
VERGVVVMKIGIPESLLYFSYSTLWNTFFEELGADVILSGGTNKTILDAGTKYCVDEACLPVKIHHGHVMALSNKADAIFIPRVMSISKNEYICPKFCGLPEMVKNSIDNLPHIIDTTINMRKNEKSVYYSMINAGKIVTSRKSILNRAFYNAMNAQIEADTKIKDNWKRELEYSDVHCMKIGLIGHPYNIYDSFANMNIIEKLKQEGCSVVTIEMLDEDRININAKTMGKRHFWTFGRKIVGAGLSFISNKDVDGIISITSFGCGIDSMMEDYIERHIKRDGCIPYMKLVLDEHSGEAGFDTRLEAFLDMVKWRRENESYISPYGGNICSNKSIS